MIVYFIFPFVIFNKAPIIAIESAAKQLDQHN